MCNFEQSGFCLSGTLLPVFQDDPPSWSGLGRANSLGAAHGGARCSKPRLASLAAGVEKLRIFGTLHYVLFAPPTLHITPDARRDLVYAVSATGCL
jgi:hypothetical protein